MTKDKLSCQAFRGGNICGRFHQFIITDDLTGNVYFSCTDCVARVMVENDVDSAQVERVYDYSE